MGTPGPARADRVHPYAPADDFHVFDTTLRDGAQREGINLTVADKLAIARHLDDFGVGFIEGGWPGANPRDTEF
ncbi:citramalate synthase, partial [Streptomyces iakyrus]